MKCPICGKGDLLKYSGLPESLNLVDIIEEHPLPIMRGWAKNKVSEMKKKIEEKYYYRKCNACGLILFFEEV